MKIDSFKTVCDLLIGSWSGYRRSAGNEREEVRSEWLIAFDGSFLQEHWYTAGDQGSPGWTAEAFFRILDAGPGDFIAVYKGGKIAFGESDFSDSAWNLTHRWLREPGVAVISLRFLDEDTYQQEVSEVGADGVLIPESFAVMKRRPASK